MKPYFLFRAYGKLISTLIWTAQKMKFSVKDFFGKCEQKEKKEIQRNTKEILNGKLHFLCSPDCRKQWFYRKCIARTNGGNSSLVWTFKTLRQETPYINGDQKVVFFRFSVKKKMKFNYVFCHYFLSATLTINSICFPFSLIFKIELSS